MPQAQTLGSAPVQVVDCNNIDETAKTFLASGHMRGLFSQLGEDGTLLWIFSNKKSGYYVDIGCHHPTIYSNTAALHAWHGWSGFNVDIDERAIDLFEKWRPRDVNIVAGVGGQRGSVDAFIFKSGALSTLDPQAASNPHWAHVERTKVRVEVYTLEYLLTTYVPVGQHIDLMNIDAEGLDFEILSSNDWQKFRPDVLVVESHGFNPNDPSSDPTFQFLRGQDYSLISHTVITSIYQSTRP